MTSISLAELGAHNKEGDAWIAVKGKVYDVSSFNHPGGKKILMRECGKDATEKFMQFHKPEVLAQHAKMQIGVLATAEPSSEGKAKKTEQPNDPRDFGDLVPYGDPNWYQGCNTIYYKDSHHAWRAKVRAFVDTELAPFVANWEQTDKGLPKELYVKAAKAGILAASCGPVWPTKYTGVAAPEGYDAFHELILYDELCRSGSGGVVWGLIEGLSIGLPPILLFGSEELKERVAPVCLRGEKFICLCISEPSAGSDVAGMQTTASREGDVYVVNGAKKWITNGIWADYFTVAVRTGTKRGSELSILLVDKNMPGVKCVKMDCTGVWGSGTTYVTFEDVRVPVQNLIGKEGEGFKMIMYNFNHERWGFAAQATRFARVCYEESFKYAMSRKTFGKPLIEHQMIRWKLAEMARQVEATHNWLENITYQLSTMPKLESNPKLGGSIALLKAQATKTFEYCSREAVQIFGGAAYVRSGRGAKVERLARDVKAMAIPGGSEEIMLDFGIRQAMKASARARL